MSNQLSWKTGWSWALPPSHLATSIKCFLKSGSWERWGERQWEAWNSSSTEQFWVSDWPPALTHCLEKPLSTENTECWSKSELLAHCLTEVRLLMLRYFEYLLKNKRKTLYSVGTTLQNFVPANTLEWKSFFSQTLISFLGEYLIFITSPGSQRGT